MQSSEKKERIVTSVMNSDEVDAELSRAAFVALSQWQYIPVLLNGEPVEVETTIKMNFKLGSEMDSIR